jgi:hypothetical protein
MPFVRGRYHINPTMGDALEAAREAEAALLALEQQARQERDSGKDEESPDGESTESGPGTGPIHRVEIEAAELVPSSSGRAARGFVARVHRQPPSVGGVRDPSSATAPETQVFSDHRDLVNFLADALAQDAAKRT